MSNFKEQIQQDVAVFLNPQEFADIMNIDGQDIAALWDNENTPLAEPEAWGINIESAVLLVAENSIPLPVPDQHISVNGQGWKVRKALPQQGILRLELERNTS